jgi:hypothetical protein
MVVRGVMDGVFMDLLHSFKAKIESNFLLAPSALRMDNTASS